MRAGAELTRSVKQIQIASNPQPPQLLGNTWFWGALAHAPAQKPVDEGRLADIGEANDSCPDRPRLQASGFASIVDAVAQ